ncbi:ABC transporter ATP-binding protein [Candidimonas nitroreducens]|uniref:ABC transporter ATP-binding protein n=1 Tax=Candidimonas nitroreducens TaxID=683354 RepID=UPI0011783E5F|nr:ABC transporter ATP-binding protein [Candidimonas nitroreducens]
MNAPVIEAASLVKRYGATTAVDGVSFDVGQGEIFGLLGPNGAGKTTTILMLLGLTEASGGKVRVLGHDPWREPLTIKRRLGYLPDSVGFYDHLTGFENLAYTARLIGLPAAERRARIMQALDKVRLAEAADKRAGAYSHGMRRRLGLAEVIMKQARVAILDEPTSGLDPQSTEEFLELIRELKSDGVTVLLSSHLLDHMQRICDRVALFHRGRIALIGSVRELAGQVLGDGFEVRLEASGPPLQEPLRGVAGVSGVQVLADDTYLLRANRDVRADAARAAVQAGAALRQLSVTEPSLDAIYNSYFQSGKTQEEPAHAT